MAPTLAHFPSVCLETIFSHVPLDDLFRSIGLVCQSWYMSRKTVQKRLVRLVLVGEEYQLNELNYNWVFCPYGTDLFQHVRRDDGSPWLTLKSFDQIKFDSLVVPDNKLVILNKTSVMNLSKITHLTLMYEYVPNATITQMIRLIEQFSEHLIDLKLSFSFCSRIKHYRDTEEIAHNLVDLKLTFEDFEENDSGEEEIAHNMTNLFACLNRLQALRKLRLKIYLVFEFSKLKFRPQLEFLSRLTTFAILVNGIEDWANWILTSVRQFGRNIRSIELHKDIQLQDMLKVDPQLDEKFKVLYLEDVSVQDYDDMRRYCTRFTMLTTLKLPELSMPMTMLARCLSQLLHLVHLFFCLNFIPQEEQPQSDIVPVRSVRLLDLDITTESHRDSEMLFISNILTNIQALIFSHEISECSDCKISDSAEIHDAFDEIAHSNPELASRIIECKRLFRQPFRRCPKLHTISIVDKYVGQRTLISVSEL